MFLKTRSTLSLALAVVVFLAAAGAALAQSGPAKAKVNINTATASELESLPRIGPKVAQRIVDYRNQNGNFKKVEDIMKVRGIGEKLFEQIKDRITVGSESQAK